jgi:hypothetical protein
VKSALMTSSVQSVTNVDGSKAGVFDRGAGSIRADRAVSSTLTISETAADFVASAGDPLSRIDLNIPSVYIDPLPGAAVVERTVTNVTNKSQTIRVKTHMAGGAEAFVSPSVFSLQPGKSRTVKVVLSGIDAKDGWHEGQLTFTSQRHGTIPVVVPVAVNVGDAKISLAQSCTPEKIARGDTATCTVTASSQLPVDVEATIDVAASNKLKVTTVGAPATKKNNGATWTGTLSAALPPTVDAVNPVPAEETPGGGFLPLGDFGIDPVAGVGDESIVNFDVPEFVYGGEVYDRIGVVSNGYVVVGGGTSADVSAEPPASFPDAAVPNNVIAPFWTDLDPSAGGSVSVGSLSDGVTDFLIIEWNGVPTFSGGGSNSFQVWITLGADEQTYITYGGPLTPDAAVGSLTGAENRTGSSGVTVADVDPDSGYQVLTSPPTAGGAVTFDYTVKGLAKGNWSTVAKLTSPALNTIPVEKTQIKVK